ncbi:MAG: CxxxxCH/CxxCH domain-containing protein [Myxococcales bacterium]|nr:CxxxxCH/CxxCH domain-containing protein [Myxococcales bacterium]
MKYASGMALVLALMLTGCGSDEPAAGDGGDARVTDGVVADGGGDGLPPRDGAAPDGDAAIGDGGGDAAPIPPCSRCHGGVANAAPPLSLSGLTATTERGVGAHQSHLRTSTWHAQILCSDCHVVPKNVTDPGHIDSALPAELTFSARAKSDGAQPTWDGLTCAGAYCHGATLSGGTYNVPIWTLVDGSQVVCGTCHGLPPTKNHPNNTNCSMCHGAVVDANRKIINPALHIDGKVDATGGGHPTGWAAGLVHGSAFYQDPNSCKQCHGATLDGDSAKSCNTCHPGWRTNCVFCHGGTDNQTGAPPAAVDGKVATTVPAVGRHTSHVTAGSHPAYDCTVCHVKPTDALSPGHIDPSPGDVVFHGQAAGASYNTSTYTCSNVSCHGNGRGSNGSALWVGSLSGGCSACHDAASDGSSMTLSGRHRKHIVGEGIGCATCHNCVVSNNTTISNGANHVNGSIQVCGPAINSYNPVTSSCSPACHGSERWF